MDVASCRMIDTFSVRNETIKMFVPLLSRTATPITNRNNIGSVHAVVVTESTAKIMITATTRILLISLAMDSVMDLFWTAMPT